MTAQINSLTETSGTTTAAPRMPWTLPPAFAAMQPYAQWFIYRLHHRDANGKYQKEPIDARTRAKPLRDCGGIKMCADWATVAQVAAELQASAPVGEFYVPGFYFTASDPFWFLDIDGCVIRDAQGQLAWSSLAIELLNAFPNAARERSSSQQGWHVIGSGKAPKHACKNISNKVEFYTEDRGVALTGIDASGNAAADYSTSLPWLIERFFQLNATSDRGAEWTSEPRADWHGPDDDAALINIALRTRSPGAVFGVKASFKDLWNANETKLARAYPSPSGDTWDRSGADQALANHLAFYTGCNCERMERLMRESPLTRDKWDRADYLRNTILKACAVTKNRYNDGKRVVPAGAPVPATNAATPGIGLDDFHAYLPDHAYIFIPTREPWPAASVDAAVKPWPDGMKPSAWLDSARPIHQMTWAPGEPMVITNRVAADGGWIHRDGTNTFNLYRPPVIQPGDASLATPWLELLRCIYPNDADHLVKWFAHRRQRPDDKINHALVFGGSPGIGKDTIMEPLKQAVGPWNFKEVAPKDLLGDFNPHVKAVVLRVSEARDSGDMSRFALYEHCKTLLACPPDVLRCNEKNLREHAVFNKLGVVFTTNHPDGLYLAANDRRHYVAWSERERTEFSEDYWKAFYAWLHTGGLNHVVAYLDTVDLTGFDPKAPPPLTPAFWAMVDAGRAPEEGEMTDALEKLNYPPALTLDQLVAAAGIGEFQSWLRDRRNRKQIGHRLRSLGYEPVRNDADKHDGQWRVNGKRQTIYARKDLPERARLAAAAELCRVSLNVGGVGGFPS